MHFCGKLTSINVGGYFVRALNPGGGPPWTKFFVAIVLLWSSAVYAADSPKVAFVVALKGGVFVPTPGVSSRPGTAVRLLQPLTEQQVLRVTPGGSVTVSFARGGKRVAIDKPGDYKILSTSVDPSAGTREIKPASASSSAPTLADVDLRTLGAMSNRALARIYLRGPQPRINLASLPRNLQIPTGEIPLFYRESKEGGAGEWKEGKAHLEHTAKGDTLLIPMVPLQAGKFWDLRLLDKGEPDFWVCVYDESQLGALKALPEYQNRSGRLEDEMVVAYALKQYKLYDEALEVLSKLPQDDETVRQAIEDTRAEKKSSEQALEGKSGDGGGLKIGF